MEDGISNNRSLSLLWRGLRAHPDPDPDPDPDPRRQGLSEEEDEYLQREKAARKVTVKSANKDHSKNKISKAKGTTLSKHTIKINITVEKGLKVGRKR